MAFPMRSNVKTYAGGGTSGLIRGFQIAEAQARAANIAREKELRGMYGKIEERYAPGGAFQKGALAEIEAAGVRGRGREMQQLISSGMYGTTTAAGIPSRWEAEVGTPARLKLEDISMERLTQAQMAKAGFIERIQEPYPDYGPMMQAIQAASAVPPSGGGDSWGAYDPNWFENLRGTPRGGGYTHSTPATSTYGQAAQPTAATSTPTTARRAATTPAGYGQAAQPIGGKQLTSAEQFTVQERLKAMYPQMYKPGWGKTTTPAETSTKKASWWSGVGKAYGGLFQ